MNLQCPKCRTPLIAAGDYYVLPCCTDWPVVAGIPVFTGPVAELVRLIRDGNHRRALLLALGPQITSRLPGKLGSAERKLKRYRWHLRANDMIDNGSTARDWFDFMLADQLSRDYFFYRFSQPKHLAALSVGTILPSGPLLDLGCGAGHITRGLRHDRRTVGVDNTFWLLYVAKRIIHPGGEYVCADANQRLPFPDGAFASVVSTNTFHFLANQSDAWSELQRVSTGPIALVSLRNADVPHYVPNHAQSVAGYHELAGSMPHRIVSDASIVARYQRHLGPNLVDNEAELSTTPLVTLFADRDESRLITHGQFSTWPHAGEGINPLYRRVNGHYELQWPSEAYKADNPGFDYLPRTVEYNLTENYVQVDMPARYM